MNFKTKLLLIGVLPLVAVSILTGVVIYYQSSRLIEAEIAEVEKRIITSKRQEIENYISLALTSIRHIYLGEIGGRQAAQSEVKRILHDMTFGEDGYFFVYDKTGTNLVHPKLKQLVGKNWWDLQDPNGDFVIRNLIAKAQGGGGFHRYVWNKPTSGKPAEKLGYAAYLQKWDWMFGTGLYIDDIAREVALIRADIKANVAETATILFLLTMLGVGIVAASVLMVRLSEHKLADIRLKELTKRIVDIQERERKRVSTELHDGISQLLVSVRYTLDAAHARLTRNKRARSLVAKSIGILESAINEVRRISKDLRPSVLDDMGLAAAVTSLTKDFQSQTGIEVEVAVERVENRLTEEAKTALYRVVQEALTNIARHAQADAVTVALTLGRTHLKLTIGDNGVGLAAGSAHSRPGIGRRGPGIGVRNMTERVESHGGILKMAQNKDRGTLVTVRLPISAASAKELAA
ncbi:MAG: cache domain-containing protein [Alphaproteobacteria bacterium]